MLIVILERVMGIEPIFPPWKGGIIAIILYPHNFPVRGACPPMEGIRLWRIFFKIFNRLPTAQKQSREILVV